MKHITGPASYARRAQFSCEIALSVNVPKIETFARESDVLEETTEQLVARARLHDAEAFTELIRRFEGIALSIAYANTGKAADAGDVTQEAFMRAWQKLDTLDDPSRFGHWLGRMVRNLSIDLRRRKRPGSLENSWDISAGEDPSERLERDEARERIDKALETLDEVTRSCVILRYYENLSSKEIGEQLGLSPAAIDMRLSRARTTLKERLGENAAL